AVHPRVAAPVPPHDWAARRVSRSGAAPYARPAGELGATCHGPSRFAAVERPSFSAHPGARCLPVNALSRKDSHASACGHFGAARATTGVVAPSRSRRSVLETQNVAWQTYTSVAGIRIAADPLLSSAAERWPSG